MKKNQTLKTVKKICCLPPFPTLVIAVPSFALVIFVLVNGIYNSPLSYLAYILSAYALVISLTGMVGMVKRIRRGIDDHPLVRRLLEIPLIGRFFNEAAFRTETSLYQGLLVNFLYVGVKLFSGIYYRSVWFVTLAVYYIMLVIMKLSLIHYMRNRGNAGEDKAAEFRRYRLCGILLLFMNWALVGIVVLVIVMNSGFQYPGVLIYAMALYTFCATITAVVNVVKYRKYGSPVMSAAKVINLTAALVSMLALETAMITQFGSGEDAAFRQTMTASTGAGVSMIVLGMAIYMIVRSTRQLRVIRQETQKGE